jgi:hypothetical protein
MIRKGYKLIDFYCDYSLNTDKCCVFIRINSIGRDANTILKTLDILNATLEELKDGIEFLIEEYETLPESWERYNKLKDLGWDVQCHVYFKGQLVVKDKGMLDLE